MCVYIYIYIHYVGPQGAVGVAHGVRVLAEDDGPPLSTLAQGLIIQRKRKTITYTPNANKRTATSYAQSAY